MNGIPYIAGWYINPDPFCRGSWTFHPQRLRGLCHREWSGRNQKLPSEYPLGASFSFKKNSVVLVREWSIPTERPPPVGEVSAIFCG